MKKKLLLVVSGSIAAYKIPNFIRLLKKKNYDITVVLTPTAEKFVSKLSIEVVSENKCYTEDDAITSDSHHLMLSRNADALLIMPATANSIAKCAYGIADTLASTLYTTFEGPVLICPAMHTEMVNHKPYIQNIDTLKKQGVFIVGPISGELACGDMGLGRMVEPADVIPLIDSLFYEKLNLVNKKICITAGGTIENIDPVRVITNLSSGKLGVTLAQLAYLYGAEVTIISSKQVPNIGFHHIETISTVESIKQQLNHHMKEKDVLIMAAAISDFKPIYSETKVRRNQKKISIECEPTEDLLKAISAMYKKCFKIGFCLADNKDLDQVALSKCIDKQTDIIVANSPQNLGNNSRDIKVFDKNKCLSELKKASLTETAHHILSFIR